MKKMNLLVLCILTLSLFYGCASAPKSYTKGTFERPEKVLVILKYDEQNWREDWRIALEQNGYDVIFQDEVLITNRTTKSNYLDVERRNVIEDKNIRYEFRLSYVAKWDFVWFVKNVSISVRDLRTGNVIGSYRDNNFWAHPSVFTVVNTIEKDFFSTLWIN